MPPVNIPARNTIVQAARDDYRTHQEEFPGEPVEDSWSTEAWSMVRVSCRAAIDALGYDDACDLYFSRLRELQDDTAQRDVVSGDSITDAQIKTLAIEAAAHGDHEMVATCKRALGKRPGDADRTARRACAAAINRARAAAGACP